MLRFGRANQTGLSARVNLSSVRISPLRARTYANLGNVTVLLRVLGLRADKHVETSEIKRRV